MQNHQQKFTSPSFIVQVTHIEIMNAIHQLLNFEECGLVNLIAFVITVRGRVLHGQPLPIPVVHQHLPLLARAVCAAKADIYAQVIYLHARQGQYRTEFEILSPHSETF